MLRLTNDNLKHLKPKVATCLENLEPPYLSIDALKRHPVHKHDFDDQMRLTKLKDSAYASLRAKTESYNKKTKEYKNLKTDYLHKLGTIVDENGNPVKSWEEAKYILLNLPSSLIDCLNAGRIWKAEKVTEVLRSSKTEDILVRFYWTKFFLYVHEIVNAKLEDYCQRYLHFVKTAKQQPVKTTTLRPGMLLVAGLLDEYGTREALAQTVCRDYSNQVTDLACAHLLIGHSAGQVSFTHANQFALTAGLLDAQMRLSDPNFSAKSWLDLYELHVQNSPPTDDKYSQDDLNNALLNFFCSLNKERRKFDKDNARLAFEFKDKHGGKYYSDKVCLNKETFAVYSTDFDLEGNPCDDFATYFYAAEDFKLGARLGFARAHDSKQTLAVVINRGSSATEELSDLNDTIGMLKQFHHVDEQYVAKRGSFHLNTLTTLIKNKFDFAYLGRTEAPELKALALDGQYQLSHGGFDSSRYVIPGSTCIGSLQHLNLTQSGLTNEYGWPVIHLLLDDEKSVEYDKISIQTYVERNKTPSWTRFRPNPVNEYRNYRPTDVAVKHKDKPLKDFIAAIEAELKFRYSKEFYETLKEVLETQLDPGTKIAVMSVCEPDKYLTAFRAVMTEAQKAVAFVTKHQGAFDRNAAQWLSFSPLVRKLVTITWEVPQAIPEELKQDPVKLAEYVEQKFFAGDVVREAQAAESTPETYWNFVSADCVGMKPDSTYRRTNARLILHYAENKPLQESELTAQFWRSEHFEKLFAYDKADFADYLEVLGTRYLPCTSTWLRYSQHFAKNHTKRLLEKGIVFGMTAQLDATLQAKLDALIAAEELSADWDIAEVLRNLQELQVKVTEGAKVRLILNNDEQKQALKVFGWDNIWNVPERMREFVCSLNQLKPFLQVSASEVQILPAKLPL